MPSLKLGEMAEWSNAHAWKACKVSKPSRVRIPLSPPSFKNSYEFKNFFQQKIYKLIKYVVVYF